MSVIFFFFHDRKPHPGCIEQCIIDGIVLAQKILLRNITDLIFHAFIFLVDIRSFIADFSFRGFISHDGIHEGGLSGTGSAQDQDHAAGQNIQPDIPEKGLLFSAQPDISLFNPDREAFTAVISRPFVLWYGRYGRFDFFGDFFGVVQLCRDGIGFGFFRYIRIRIAIYTAEQFIFQKHEIIICNPDHVVFLKIYRLFNAGRIEVYAIQTAVIQKCPAFFCTKQGSMPPGDAFLAQAKLLISAYDDFCGIRKRDPSPDPILFRCRRIDQNHIHVRIRILLSMDPQDISVRQGFPFSCCEHGPAADRSVHTPCISISASCGIRGKKAVLP